MTQLYPQQLDGISQMCKALDAIPEIEVVFGRIEVRTPHGELLGYLVDEVGGSFSFAGTDWYDNHKGGG